MPYSRKDRQLVVTEEGKKYCCFVLLAVPVVMLVLSILAMLNPLLGK